MARVETGPPPLYGPPLHATPRVAFPVSTQARYPLFAWTPNALTVLRLLAAASFPFVPDAWRVPIVVAAALSDWLDGFLARRYGFASPLGALLDGIADKAVTLSVLGTFAHHGVLAWWQLAIIMSRDLAVGAIALVIACHRAWPMFRKLAPSWSGKATTFAVFALMVVLLVAPAWTPWLLYPAGALSLLAAGDYVRQFLPAYRQWRASAPAPH